MLESGGVDSRYERADDGVEDDGQGGLVASCEDRETEAVRVEKGDAGSIVVGYAVFPGDGDSVPANVGSGVVTFWEEEGRVGSEDLPG